MDYNKTDVYRLESYNFDLPAGLIAQYPVEPRDSSRLLVLDKRSGKTEDKIFVDLLAYLNPGDTLVLNDTRVIPARLLAFKDSGARAEILLLKKQGDYWEALVKPGRKLRMGSRMKCDLESPVEIEVIEELNYPGGRLLAFHNCIDEEAFINQMGHIPLPPYINRQDQECDRERYQTVYARESGSAAAPTAGLHFTQDLLNAIEEKGVNIARVLLHVGPGTFRPVKCEDIRLHKMHYEYYRMEEQTAQLLNQTRQKGRNIIAVGTTVVRTLETIYNDVCGFSAQEGQTGKFIYPGYRFMAIDALISNFHLPGSSLLMLVAAFAGIDPVMAAYRHAVEARYRFFSYGDAMLIK
ncbi:MAG: tRNA preQ1(34) S-adenosylmethionine ribosyltransferase-isomerase QueA [Syntrophomonas sp.]